MARANWDDFTSKWGFEEGATLEDRDFEARSRLVQSLNDEPAIQKAELRAVAYDRPGLHNCCMILVLPARGQSDDELLSLWRQQAISERPLPPGLELNEFIAAAYEE